MGVKFSQLPNMESPASEDQIAVLDVSENILKKIKIAHAATSTVYGPGTTSSYGHVKLANNLTSSSYANGVALAAYQGYVLSGNISTVSGNLSTLSQTVNTMSGQVSTLSGQVSGLDSSVSTLSNSVNTLNNRVGTAENTVSTLSGQVTNLSTNVSTLDTKVTKLSSGKINLAVNPSSTSDMNIWIET